MNHYWSERDFLLAFVNDTRKLWAERFLEFPLCAEEAWRIDSYDFYRERFEQRFLDVDNRALDLRPAPGEDPGSEHYKTRLISALAQKTTVVGAAVVHVNTLFRIPFITPIPDNPHSGSVRVWSLKQPPSLPAQVRDAVDILQEAQVAAVASLVAVDGSGFAIAKSGLVDQPAGQWFTWERSSGGPDLEGWKETLEKGVKRLKALESNPFAPPEQGPYFPALDNALYSSESVGCLRAGLDPGDRSRDPEDLLFFQRAALRGGEGFCLEMETKRIKAIVQCPIVAAVSVDCLPFGERLDRGAPAFVMVSSLASGLEQSVSITAKEIADKRLPEAELNALAGLRNASIIIAADWSSLDSAYHLPPPLGAAGRLPSVLSDFYANPRLTHDEFNLDALAEAFRSTPRSSALSVPEAARLFDGSDPGLMAKAKEICAWKIQTVRKSLIEIERRMLAGLYYTKDVEEELWDGKAWAICQSSDIDRALAQGLCLPPKAQAKGINIGLF